MAEKINIKFNPSGLSEIIKGMDDLSKYSKRAGKTLDSEMKKANKTMQKTNKLASDRSDEESKILDILEKHNLNLDQTLRQERTMKTILADYKRDWADVNKSTKSASRFVANFLQKSDKGFTGKIVSGARGMTDSFQFMGATMGVIGAQFAPIITGLKLFTSLGKGIIGLLVGADYELTQTTKSLYEAAGAIGNLEKGVELGKTGAAAFKKELVGIAKEYKINVDELFDAVTEFGKQGGNVLKANLGDGAFNSVSRSIAKYSRLFQTDVKAVASLAAQMGSTFGNSTSTISGGLDTIFKYFNRTGMQSEKFIQTIMGATESMSLYGNTTSLTSRVLNRLTNQTLSSANAIKEFNRIQGAGPQDKQLRRKSIQRALSSDETRAQLAFELKRSAGDNLSAEFKKNPKASIAEITKKLGNRATNQDKRILESLRILEKGVPSFAQVAALETKIPELLLTPLAVQGSKLLLNLDTSSDKFFLIAEQLGIEADTFLRMVQNANEQQTSIFQAFTADLSQSAQSVKDSEVTVSSYLDELAKTAGEDTTSILDEIKNIFSEIKTILVSDFSGAIDVFGAASMSILRFLSTLGNSSIYRTLTGQIWGDAAQGIKDMVSDFRGFLSGEDKEVSSETLERMKRSAAEGAEVQSRRKKSMQAFLNQAYDGSNTYSRLAGITGSLDIPDILNAIEAGTFLDAVRSDDQALNLFKSLKNFMESLNKWKDVKDSTRKEGTVVIKAAMNTLANEFTINQEKLKG